MSAEDMEAYRKWCDERQRATKEQEQQKQLLEMWEKQEETRKMEAERKAHEQEAAERHESMMSQWKMWQMKITQMHTFDDLTYTFAESKHHYMFLVMTEFLKFCKCSDYTEEFERYFMHDGSSYHHDDDFDLEELDAINTNDAFAVARALAGQSKADQNKAFFGGLAESLCSSARSYVEQVREWEKTYNFLDH